MNSVKTVVIVVVLAAVGYMVFVSISGNRQATPPPGAPQQAGEVPKVKLPEVGTEGYSVSTPPAGSAVGGGDAPRFVPGQTPTVSMQGAGPPGDPSAPPDVGQTSVPPASSPGTPGAATDPGAPEPGRAPDGEIREAFTRFIEAAYTELDTAFLEQDPRRLAEVLEQLSKWYNHPQLTPAESRRLTELLDQVAGTVVYSRQHLLEAPYQVRSGDTLQRIGQLHNVPWELLAKINGIRDPQNLQPGQEIKVIHGPFHAVIDLEEREMTLLLQGRYYAGRFPVGTGRGQRGLLGDYTVLRKTPAPPNSPPGGLSLQLSDRVAIQAAGEAAPADDSPDSIRLDRRDMRDVYDILSVGSRIVIRR